MSSNSVWLVWALLSAIFAAATTILAKAGLKKVDSDYAALLRTVVIACLLAVFVAVARKWQNPLTLPLRAAVFLLLSGIAAGASWVCYFRALKVGEAFRVGPVDKLSVVLVVAFATIFLGERPSLRDWLGVAMIVAGAIVLAVKR
jgi:transporter family protein